MPSNQHQHKKKHPGDQHTLTELNNPGPVQQICQAQQHGNQINCSCHKLDEVHLATQRSETMLQELKGQPACHEQLLLPTG